MIDHMLRAACCRCRCLRARPDTTEITYEVREGAQIEPAPHFFAPAAALAGRCRCARLTILLLLCDAQASDLPDEATRF